MVKINKIFNNKLLYKNNKCRYKKMRNREPNPFHLYSLSSIIYSLFAGCGREETFFKDGKLLYDSKLPSIIDYHGTMSWYLNNKKHRDDDENSNPQPAEIYNIGDNIYNIERRIFCEYWKNGKFIKYGFD